MTTCSTCGAVVTITHSLRIGRRVVTWALCIPCHLQEERA